MKKEKGIIFGAGFLGNRLSGVLGYPVVPRTACDLTEPRQIQAALEAYQQEVVINCAGKTGGPGEIGIDWCETHMEETIASNVIAPINLSTACSRKGIYFVHFGSGCVYYGDNNGKGFSEEDPPNFYGPQFYAMTKIDSERVLRNLPGLLLRIRMPIDNRHHPRNLIDKLAGYTRVIDVQNSMTTVPEMIVAVQALIETREQGIYNLVSPGTISAADIMATYKSLVDGSHTFEVMGLEELNKITKGIRSNCVLNASKLQEKLKSKGLAMPGIHVAVERCLREYADAKRQR